MSIQYQTTRLPIAMIRQVQMQLQAMADELKQTLDDAEKRHETLTVQSWKTLTDALPKVYNAVGRVRKAVYQQDMGNAPEAGIDLTVSSQSAELRKMTASVTKRKSADKTQAKKNNSQ